MDWSMLGIAPTKDKKEISKAYRARLVKVNPEDKPEEFKALRAAYEEALHLAEETEEPAKEKTPIEQWIDRVEQLYQDFQSRIQPEKWRELLADEICIALDTRPFAEEALLRFFMERYYVPQAVWILLDEEFHFMERQQELYEKFPRDYIDYVILDGIRYADDLPYELFIPGENGSDCDAYRLIFRKASRMSYEEAASDLEEMQKLSERHPYGDALILQAEIAKGSESAREELFRLTEAYPDDLHMLMIGAGQYGEIGQWEDCERLYRRVLEKEPTHFSGKWQLAHCLASQNRHKEAVELIGELMHAAGGDQKQLHFLNETRKAWNEILIGQYQEMLQTNPEDQETRLELAWYLLQNNRDVEAAAVAESIDASKAEPFDYYNMMSALAFEGEDSERTLEYIMRLIEIVKALEPDGTEKTQRRIDRLPEMMTRHAHILLKMDRREEALAEYEQALELAPENAELLTKFCQFCFYVKNHKRMAELAERLTQVRPSAYHGYLLLAQAMYELHRDQDAFDAVNRAIQLDGGDLYEYVLKMEILMHNGVFDEVRSVLDFLRENGIPDDNLAVEWFEAQLTEYETKDREKALARYRGIAERVEKGEEFDWSAKLYLRITSLIGEDMNANKEEDREQMLAVLEKALSHDPENPACLDYKAWLLKKAEKNSEALELYHKLEKLPHRSMDVERELAELYYRDLYYNADKALHYYQMLIDDEDDADLHFYAGMCHLYMKQLKEAEWHFLREQEMAPDDVDGYYRLGYVYEAMGRYEAALQQAEKTIEIVKDREGNQGQYYIRRIQILLRLRRPEEAIAGIRELMKKYGYSYGENLISESYRQFGMWEEEQKHIDVWRKNRKERADAEKAQIELYLCLEQIEKAKKHFKKHEAKFSQGDRWTLRRKIALLEGDLSEELQVVKAQLEEDQDSTYHLMHMAWAEQRLGKMDQMRAHAQKALLLLNEELQTFDPDEILWSGEKSFVLALLGRIDEARIELARMRTLPLCQQCNYCSCKDADVYEALIEQMAGNFEKAQELAGEGRQKWPDETDFLILELQLKRRKKMHDDRN